MEANRDSLRPLLAVIGRVPLKDLTVQDVRTALKKMAATHSTRTLQKGHNCLTRAVRQAEGQDLVRRNVSALVDTPRGLEGRPSQSLTLAEASALLEAAEASRLYAFIVLCLLTGVRSEEARALTWEHVDLEAGTISVWRSVRAHGDTKTNRSRRTLKLPEIAVEALWIQQERQARERGEAGELWQEHGLVFTTSVGTGYESHNLRRDFRRVTAAAGLGRPLGPEGAADLVRQHDELPRCAGRGDRAAGRACQLADDRGDLPAGAAPGDHDRGRGHGPDLPAEAAADKYRDDCRMKNLGNRVERHKRVKLASVRRPPKEAG